jgi:hypothetical protein
MEYLHAEPPDGHDDHQTRLRRAAIRRGDHGAGGGVRGAALAYAIVAESSLSFLGVAVPASVPSWGGMLADGRQYVDTAWWLATFPGLCILVTALTVNVLVDLIRDARDASA